MDVGTLVRQADGGGDGHEMKVDMELTGKKRDFHHPYTPYDIQVEFMETVWRVLEAGGGRVGILESPTGTVGFPPPFFLVDWDWFLALELFWAKQWVGGNEDLCV